MFSEGTDVEGKILASLGTAGSERGLVSVDVLDYVMVGELLVDLAKFGSKMIFAMARRSAQKAVQTEVTSLAKRKLIKEVEGDLETAAAQQIAAKLAQHSTDYARKSGITPKHFKAFQDAARETNLIAVVRNENEVAFPLIEKGCPGKPKIFEPFNTSQSTGILTATTAADKELVLNTNYILISDSRAAMWRLPNGATAFFPDGSVVYMETEQEVKALHDSVGRQTIKGSYPRPGPDVTLPADELAARRAQ